MKIYYLKRANKRNTKSVAAEKNNNDNNNERNTLTE